ncbi:MAG: N,N-dimethylformamidase beta subunit family domain-containing protein [Phycisphaerae bacterium]
MPPPNPSRRDLLRSTLAASTLAALPTTAFAATDKPIVIENKRPGTRDWLLTKTRIDPATKYRCPWVEGYCSHTSIAAGDTLRIFVSTNPPSRFTIDIYRTGYYDGAGGRHMTTLGPFDGKNQPDPPVGPNRLRECRWDVSTELKIPADWPSGVYVGKLTEHREGLQSYVIFVVRDDRNADLIFQVSDTTWQAYNRWPSQFSLYDDGKAQWYWGAGVDVSFDRPYGKYCQILDQPLSIGSGEYFLWEFPLAYWLEQHGYDVTYTSNLDTHAAVTPPTPTPHPPLPSLMRAKGFLSVGHDEYYSLKMFDNLKLAIGYGLNVAFLSGNTCCGRIDPRPSSAGEPDRIFGRVDHFGPPDNEERKKFVAMDKLPHRSPNEATLIGARSTGAITGGGAWVCSKPDHWLFAGTGMKLGDSIPGLVGWEWHGDPATGIHGLEIVSTGPVGNEKTKKHHGTYTATLYPGSKNNVVFNASSCWWADALSEPPGYVRPQVYATPKGVDERARQITRNLLARMIRPIPV